ncbi:MAG: Asp-tRNA(Asn)/Glu-tRNA(Gln) amidotransferase subunit GatC [Clostridia bacterium]|nr:Asp-tRNA(Asn)/Glu-tRNA(Gln) amidotransferase subunit GatC [Clostridia bacterium]
MADEVVRKVAELARLALPEDELRALTADLARILERVARLGTVDVEGVPPFSHGALLESVWREDDPRPGLPREAALALAPEARDGYYRVPVVVRRDGEEKP